MLKYMELSADKYSAIIALAEEKENAEEHVLDNVEWFQNARSLKEFGLYSMADLMKAWDDAQGTKEMDVYNAAEKKYRDYLNSLSMNELVDLETLFDCGRDLLYNRWTCPRANYDDNMLCYEGGSYTKAETVEWFLSKRVSKFFNASRESIGFTDNGRIPIYRKEVEL